jgi:hypothetical protein
MRPQAHLTCLGLSLPSACLPHELQPCVQTLVLRGSKMYVHNTLCMMPRSCTVSPWVSERGPRRSMGRETIFCAPHAPGVDE